MERLRMDRTAQLAPANDHRESVLVRIKQLLVRGCAAAILATTAFVGLTVEPASANPPLTCAAMEQRYDEIHALGDTFLDRGISLISVDHDAASYWIGMAESFYLVANKIERC